jgi:ABC-type nitrate/sulfonate/bicarbonate transport system substrate-binding protein
MMQEQTMIGRRSVLRLGAAAGALVFAPAVIRSAQAEPLKLTVTNAGGAAQAIHQAFLKELGYLKEFDVEPKFENVPDGSKIVAALLGGSSDACMLAGIQPVLPAVARGAKLKVIAGAALLPAFALMSKNPEVKTLKDLEGRTVGTGTPGALTYALTNLLLRKQGIDAKKVQFVNIGSTAEIFRAVVAKTVDAGLGTIAVYYQRDKYGVHAVEGGLAFDEVPLYTFQGSFTSDRAIQSKREAIVRTLAAHAKSYRFLQSPGSKDAYIKAFKAAFPRGDEAEAAGDWQYIQEKKPFAEDLIVSKERIDFMQDLNIERGVQTRKMAYEEVADMSLAHDAVALLK